MPAGVRVNPRYAELSMVRSLNDGSALRISNAIASPPTADATASRARRQRLWLIAASYKWVSDAYPSWLSMKVYTRPGKSLSLQIVRLYHDGATERDVKMCSVICHTEHRFMTQPTSEFLMHFGANCTRSDAICSRSWLGSKARRVSRPRVFSRSNKLMGTTGNSARSPRLLPSVFIAYSRRPT